MRERPPRSVYGRAIIGVIALYALVLQAFLVALSPAAPASASAGSEICAQHDEAGTPDDGGPGCRHHACCTQAHGVEAGLPPGTASTLLAWPAASTIVPWRHEATVHARAPPDPNTGPRGPPSA